MIKYYVYFPKKNTRKTLEEFVDNISKSDDVDNHPWVESILNDYVANCVQLYVVLCFILIFQTPNFYISYRYTQLFHLFYSLFHLNNPSYLLIIWYILIIFQMFWIWKGFLRKYGRDLFHKEFLHLSIKDIYFCDIFTEWDIEATYSNRIVSSELLL